MVYSFLFQIPAPCPGLKKVCYQSLPLFKLEFHLNPINKIPAMVSDIKTILEMTVNMIFDILKFVILEVPVIFFSQDKLILCNTVKAFEELLFPFTYPYPVIEILPKVYYKSLEKLSTFLVGINDEYRDSYFENYDINLNDKEYVLVILNGQQTTYSYEKKKINNYGILLKGFDKKIEKNKNIEKYSKKNVTFSKHYLNKSIEKISRLLIGKNCIKKKMSEINIEEVRYEFYYFFISLFKNYKSFLNLDARQLNQNYRLVENNIIEIDKIFRYQEFISKDMDAIDFYSCFMNTKILKNFLVKNLYPSTVEEKMEILLLDENIRTKKNKYMINQLLFKETTPFLHCDNFEIKPKKNEKIIINNDKVEELHSISYSESLIKNFPVLDDKKMEKIFTQNFMEKEVVIKNLYEEFYTECFKILKDEKFLQVYKSIGYNINITDNLKSTNEPYVFKLWTLVVCYSFKYLDDQEKWIIFYEFLNEIKVINFFRNTLIDPFLSDLIFSTFTKYGDKQMCSLLYKELSECIYVKEDYLTFMKLHKKFMTNVDEFEKTYPKNTILKERNYNIFHIPNNRKMDIVLISPHPQCQRINLMPDLLNFRGQSDIITYKCPICKKTNKAEATVSLGEDKKSDLTIQLYSAKYLFYNIKDLGDFNMQTFYQKHTEFFINLFILFQLRGYFYEFIFPYKNWKEDPRFEKEKLNMEKIQELNFIKTDENKDKTKWYEVIEDVKGRPKKLNQIIPCKITNVVNMKNTEPINSTNFFQKYNKKIVKNTMRLTKKNKKEE